MPIKEEAEVWFGLAQLKPEGEYFVQYPTHRLSGKKFTAERDAEQQYVGPAMVMRQLKGGMMLCIGDDGTKFKESLTKIRRGMIDAN